MYHEIVSRKLQRAFRDINAGAYERILPQFAETHRHVMFGEHALSGERHTIASTRKWYERLRRLLPDLQFDVQSVAVAGWPWRTRATVTWRDRFTLPDGSSGSNQGVHDFELRWGRVTRLVIHCDTARLARYCERMAGSGVTEAAAPPICDGPRPAP